MNTYVQPDLFHENEPKAKPTLAERLRSVKQRAGFWPVSTNELSYARKLIQANDEGKSTAKFLNEVRGHQQHKTSAEDPAAAVRSITHELNDHFRNARREGGALQELKDQINKTSDNTTSPNLPLSDIVGIDDYGVAYLVRYLDMKELAEHGESKKMRYDPRKTDYAQVNQDEDLANYVASKLQAVTIADADKIVPSAIVDQIQRIAFWDEQLRASREHDIARPIAEAALASSDLEIQWTQAS